MHPQHHLEAEKVHTGSTFSIKYPSIVKILPLYGKTDDKYSPKSNGHIVFPITCQSS